MADPPDRAPALQVVVGPRPGPLALDELVAAYPWPDRERWVRAMMVTTLDGGTVGADGRSRSISSVSDRHVFDAVRRLSDVVLIGAGTFRAERYRPLRARADDADARSALGLAPAPVVAIVSASLDLPWDEEIFDQSAIRPIVVTTALAAPQRLELAAGSAELVVLPGPQIELADVLARFAERGLTRVVCEGGARLLATVASAGLLDEVDLSVAPLMTSGGQVVTGAASVVPQHFSLAQVITSEDGYLFTRYVSEPAR